MSPWVMIDDDDGDDDDDGTEMLGYVQTVEDALRLIAAAALPDRCLHCAELTVRAKGLWLPRPHEIGWPDGD